MNTRWIVSFFVALLFTSCDVQDSKPIADRGTNDETSSFYLQNGQKASNATVTVFAAGGTDTLPTTRTYTNSDGQVMLSALPKGYYSLLVTDKSGRAAFVDSVYSDGAKMNLPSDTLRPTGSIKGRIKVQVQDDPKIAWVALVGEGYFHTIDDDSGFFTLKGVPAGQHTLVAKTDRGDYTSTFRATTVSSDSTTDIGTIEIVYTGLPIVTGIVGTWDSLGGTVTLRWDAATSPKVKGYNVYRSTSNDPSSEKLLGFVDSGATGFPDTLFARDPMDWTSKGLTDDSTYVRYRVSTIGQNSSEGQKWNTWSDTLRRPYLVAQMPATWMKVSSGVPRGAVRLDTLPGSLVAFGTIHDSLPSVWISTDEGQSWTLLRSEPPSSYLSHGLDQAVCFGGSIRWTRPVISGRKAPHPYLPSAFYDLIDSFRVYRMDAGGTVDSSALPAADDSVTSSRILLDSAGLVLLEGKETVNPVTSGNYLSPTHRLLETANGSWMEGNWAGWFGFRSDTRMYYYWPTIRIVSISGKVSVEAFQFTHPILDLDSLLLAPGSYKRPGTGNDWHKIHGSPENLSDVVWFDRKIYVLGNGALWTVALP